MKAKQFAVAALSAAMVVAMAGAAVAVPRTGPSIRCDQTAEVSKGAVSCAPGVPAQGGGSDVLVRDLMIDQLPFGKPGDPVWFTSAQHSYEATAYYHTNAVSLRIRGVEGATVSVNGVAVDQDGRARVELHSGVNAIVVKATRGAEQATYAVNITKVETDFRGNVKMTVTAAVNGGREQDNKSLTDGNMATSWTSTSIERSNEWTERVTGFTLDLDESRYVSRLSAWGAPQLGASVPWWHGGNLISIAVQKDANAPWQTVVTRASLRRDAGGLFYWDLNGYYQALRVRVWLNDVTGGELPSNHAITGVRFDEVEVWGLPTGRHPETAQPSGDKSLQAFDPETATWGTNRAQSLALQRGILLPAWVPSGGYGRGVFDSREQKLSGGAIPMFYDPPLFNQDAMSKLGQTPWALAKAPTGGNSMHDAKEPYEFLADSMRSYGNNLVDIQYGDEGNYSRAEVDTFAKWFEFSKQRYPGAIVHSNQNENPSWGNLKNMTHYVRTAKPDLLSWDTYYFGGGGVFGSHGPKTPSQMVPTLLGSNMWKVQRQVALQGITGDGTNPILFGQYLDYSFDSNVSESQKALVPMLSLASGMKWLGLFRMEYNGYDFGSLFDHDGAPTRAFYEYARIFRDVTGMGKYLVGLNNRFVATKAGEYDDRGSSAVPQGWQLDSFDASKASAINVEFGVNAVAAKNLGTLNGGKPGDVVLGYFDKLPGLRDEKAKSIFGTTSPKAIMVVNGMAGTTKLPSTGLKVRNDDGAYWQTVQAVTLTVSKPAGATRLMKIDPDTYQATPAELQDAGGGKATLTLTLGGGQGRLLYWAN